MRKKDGTEKVAVYARVSTGLESQQDSYENQVELYTKLVEDTPGWDLYEIYADPDFTGTTDNRPDFQRMLADAEKHKFDFIVVKSISRFARNTLLSIKTIRHLQDIGIYIYFEKEKIDTSKPYSEMMLTIMSAFAQEESRNISERIKRGLRLHAINGDISWSTIYGYEKVGDTPFVIVESEAEVVRRIFHEYEKGISAKALCDKLNLEGVKSPQGSKWTTPRLLYTLSNERYAGDVVTNKRYVKNHLTHQLVTNKGEVEQITLRDHHEGIVSHELFDRVQMIKSMKSNGTYPFGDTLICPHCGGKLTYESDFLGPKRPVWKCTADAFYLPTKNVEESVLMAYAKMDPSETQDEITKKVKAETPVFEKADYWWVDDLIDRITFGKHEGDGDRTLTVYWICGEQTTVETDIKPMYKLRYQRKLLERKRKGQRGLKRVRKITTSGTEEVISTEENGSSGEDGADKADRADKAAVNE